MFSIVIKFSRAWCLPHFFKAFEHLKFPEEKCNVLAINNSDDPLITGGLMAFLSPHSEKFKEIRIVQTDVKYLDRYHPVNMKDVPLPFHTHSARKSFELQQFISRTVKDDIHIQFEDDTLPHPDSLIKILELMKREDCVCATTPTPHRQKGFKIVGHNAYDKLTFNDEGFMLTRSNYPVLLEGIKELDASGYCGIAFRKLPFQEALNYVENLPFRIIGSGSDIYVTSHMKSYGVLNNQKILCDFSAWNVHLDLQGAEIKSNTFQNCKPWTWLWRPLRKCYKLDFIEEKTDE